MEALPDDVLRRVLEADGLRPSAIAALSCVSRRFLKLSEDVLWPTLIRQRCDEFADAFLRARSRTNAELSETANLLTRCIVLTRNNGKGGEGKDGVTFREDLVSSFSKETLLRSEEFKGETCFVSICDHSEEEPELRCFRGMIPNFEKSV